MKIKTHLLKFSFVWCHFVDGSEQKKVSCRPSWLLIWVSTTFGLPFAIKSGWHSYQQSVKCGILFLSGNVATIFFSNIGLFIGFLNCEHRSKIFHIHKLEDFWRNKYIFSFSLKWKQKSLLPSHLEIQLHTAGCSCCCFTCRILLYTLFSCQAIMYVLLTSKDSEASETILSAYKWQFAPLMPVDWFWSKELKTGLSESYIFADCRSIWLKRKTPEGLTTYLDEAPKR